MSAYEMTGRDPHDPRLALADGLAALGSAVQVLAGALGGDTRTTRTRPHDNSSPRHGAAGTANRTQERLLPSSRRPVRDGDRDATLDAGSVDAVAAEPAVDDVPTQVIELNDAPTAVMQRIDEAAGPSGGFPDRPDPSDAAAEVWALVERAKAGDGEAFGLIYDRYVETVFRFIYFRVGNRQLAEDLTSDTFLRALKRIGSFTWQGRDLGAWLVTIARNLVADHFKSGRYRLEVTTGDVLDADREDGGPEGSPEAAVVDHITNVTLLTAVKQLNPEQQECIVLRFLQGFSVAETAQAMGKNEGAIKALQYRAVRTLARLLPEGFQP
ncbi:MAG TPA: sigma-70 family RNA polymerase sigma factor [Micromonosporaceae bacterium]